MNLDNIFSGSEVRVAIFAILAGLISWIAKGIVERPFTEAAKTFESFASKRIEVLSSYLVALSVLAYFPDQKQSKEIKNHLKSLLQKEGSPVYLSYEDLQRIIRIAFDETTDDKLLMETIGRLNKDMSKITDKIRDRMTFHMRYSYCNVWKRFTSMIVYGFQLIAAMIVISGTLYLVVLAGVWASFFVN